MHYIYKITYILNDNVYIGQTVDDKKRWTAHKSFAKNPEKTGQYIHRAMAKYGIDNFIFEVIASCKTQEDTDETESLLITQYDSRNKERGYNITPGGGGVGFGTQHPNFGKKWSQEHKDKISMSLKGHKHWGPKTHSGRKFSDEAKVKMSLAKKGKESTYRKFSSQEIQAIKLAYNEGTMINDIAKNFKCHRCTISHIINNKYYKEII